MPIIIISIVGAFILLAGIYLIAKNKINRNRTITVMLSATLFPIVVLLIISIFIFVIFDMSSQWYVSFSYKILIVELLVFLFYFLSKCLTLPYSKLTELENKIKDEVSIDQSIKMLYCALYVSLILIAIFTPVILQTIKVIPEVTQPFLDMELPSPINEIPIVRALAPIAVIILALLGVLAVGLFFGLTQILAFFLLIASAFIGSIIAVQYFFIIKATIKILIASKTIRKDAIVYSIIMLIPILNIVNCIILIIKARKELKSMGFNVGLFGVKLAKEATS
jgi:hypothetical protein